MERYYDILILGGGTAALHAAEAARRQAPSASIAMVCAEALPPYSRPMLTKLPLLHYRPENTLLRPEGWYREQRIDLLLSTAAEALDASRKLVTTGAGTIGYGKCILALGAENGIPPIPGTDLPGVFTLRTAADLSALRRKAVGVREAVVIGGGVIGLEAAYRLTQAGLTVTVLEAAPWLMPRVLDEGSANYLKNRIRPFAVHTGVKVQKICGNGRVSAVEVKGMEAIPAQLVLLSCGIRPNTALARAAGAETGRGIAVNERMETSLPDVYACGDCAEFRGTNTGLWAQAVEEGAVAGTNAAGGDAVYSGSDASLAMDCPDFSLFAAGDLGKDPEKNYTQRTDILRRSPLLEINRRQTECFCHEYYCGDKLVGTFLLGDLTAMPEKQHTLTGGKP